MSTRIKAQFDFLLEADKLRGIERQNLILDCSRQENSAEHSWHICLTALMLKDHANEPINIDRVIRMLLIHDLGEIDAGDTILYSSDNSAVKAEEEAGLVRVLSLLPEEQANEYIALWREFESGESADARYARAIDRVPTLLHNLHGDGHGRC